MVTVDAAKTEPSFRFDELLARCAGRADFAERILGKFLDHFARDIEQLEQLLESEDLATLACTAHRMKGAAATVSAKSLLVQVAEIEALARQAGPTELPERLDRLRSEWSRFADIAAAAAARASQN